MTQNQVRKVTFQGEQVKGELITGQPFTTTVPANDNTLWPTFEGAQCRYHRFARR